MIDFFLNLKFNFFIESILEVFLVFLVAHLSDYSVRQFGHILLETNVGRQYENGEFMTSFAVLFVIPIATVLNFLHWFQI